MLDALVASRRRILVPVALCRPWTCMALKPVKCSRDTTPKCSNSRLALPISFKSRLFLPPHSWCLRGISHLEVELLSRNLISLDTFSFVLQREKASRNQEWSLLQHPLNAALHFTATFSCLHLLPGVYILHNRLICHWLSRAAFRQGTLIWSDLCRPHP